MPEKRNALAELARVMNTPVDMASIHDRGLVVLNAQQFSAYQKAQRIVAELAKVEDWTNDFGADEPRPYSSVSAIKECRAIAEEGAGDGK